VYKNPTVTYANGGSIWARGFAGRRVQDADMPLLYNTSLFYGGALGGEKQVRPDLRLGGYIGAGATSTDITYSYGGIDSTLAFAGAYAVHNWGAYVVKVALQGGISDNDSTRRINNNLAPGGLEIATASYDGFYISPELTVSRPIVLGSFAGGVDVLTPRVQLRYLHASLDGYTEVGSTANLTVGDRSVGTLEERADLTYARTRTLSPTSAVSANLMLGVLGTQRVSGASFGATLLGQAIPFAIPGSGSVFGAFAGVGVELRTGRIGLFASGEYLLLSDKSSVLSGKGGALVAF
jgi:outer membrane autotransporter protein